MKCALSGMASLPTSLTTVNLGWGREGVLTKFTLEKHVFKITAASSN